MAATVEGDTTKQRARAGQVSLVDSVGSQGKVAEVVFAGEALIMQDLRGNGENAHKAYENHLLPPRQFGHDVILNPGLALESRSATQYAAKNITGTRSRCEGLEL